jgi:hypothetical protein
MTLRYFDEIQYGDFRDLEVLVDPKTRELWVSQASVGRMLDLGAANRVSEKIGSKGFKSFAGKDLARPKSVKAKDITGRPNTVKAIPFDTFLKFVFWQSKQDNPAADSLLLAGFADSFSSLVLEQCGIQVTTAERQQVVSFYLTKYHEYQDWIRDTHEALYGYKPDSDYYKAVAIAINRGLFSRWSFNSDRLSNATTEELREIECFERFAMRQTSKYPGVDPLKVTKAVLQDYA